jgi:uncharacterized SAM-binding protein YcdF (DUF218 family)
MLSHNVAAYFLILTINPMSWFITNLITVFLLPPLSLFMLLAVGIFLLHSHPKAARFLLIGSLGLLWLCATPYVSEAAIHLLEARATPLANPRPEAKAIVILGGGSYFHAPEYANQDIAGTGTLLRLRYGAKLYRETHLPVLVTGGKPIGGSVSESQQMRDILEQDFQIPVKWTEDKSDNTFESARYTFNILQKAGITKVYLITQAWHIPRAAEAFRDAGFEVIEAPTIFTTRYQTDLLAFLPNASALQNSSLFVHELIGIIWYEIKSLIMEWQS